MKQVQSLSVYEWKLQNNHAHIAQTNAVKTPLLTSALLCATAHKSRIVCEQHWNNIHF